MKISQKQATLLAREIVKRLQAKRVQRLPEIMRAKINEWADKREDLKKKEKAAQEATQSHESKLWQLIGMKPFANGIRVYDKANQIIEAIEKKAIPCEHEIEDEIILKSMFADPEDMENFVQSIVSKYEKKLHAKTSATQN